MPQSGDISECMNAGEKSFVIARRVSLLVGHGWSASCILHKDSAAA